MGKHRVNHGVSGQNTQLEPSLVRGHAATRWVRKGPHRIKREPGLTGSRGRWGCIRSGGQGLTGSRGRRDHQIRWPGVSPDHGGLARDHHIRSDGGITGSRGGRAHRIRCPGASPDHGDSGVSLDQLIGRVHRIRHRWYTVSGVCKGDRFTKKKEIRLELHLPKGLNTCQRIEGYPHKIWENLEAEKAHTPLEEEEIEW